MTDDDDLEGSLSNSLKDWIHKIDADVTEIVNEIGQDANAHYNEELAKKIVKHCYSLPLWTGVARDRFEYGNIPGCSAPVESDFNNLKNRVFKRKLPLRADEFIIQHVDYLRGKGKLVASSQKKKESEKASILIEEFSGDQQQSDDLQVHNYFQIIYVEVRAMISVVCFYF